MSSPLHGFMNTLRRSKSLPSDVELLFDNARTTSEPVLVVAAPTGDDCARKQRTRARSAARWQNKICTETPKAPARQPLTEKFVFEHKSSKAAPSMPQRKPRAPPRATKSCEEITFWPDVVPDELAFKGKNVKDDAASTVASTSSGSTFPSAYKSPKSFFFPSDAMLLDEGGASKSSLNDTSSICSGSTNASASSGATFPSVYSSPKTVILSTAIRQT